MDFEQAINRPDYGYEAIECFMNARTDQECLDALSKSRILRIGEKMIYDGILPDDQGLSDSEKVSEVRAIGSVLDVAHKWRMCIERFSKGETVTLDEVLALNERVRLERYEPAFFGFEDEKHYDRLTFDIPMFDDSGASVHYAEYLKKDSKDYFRSAALPPVIEERDGYPWLRVYARVPKTSDRTAFSGLDVETLLRRASADLMRIHTKGMTVLVDESLLSYTIVDAKEFNIAGLWKVAVDEWNRGDTYTVRCPFCGRVNTFRYESHRPRKYCLGGVCKRKFERKLNNARNKVNTSKERIENNRRAYMSAKRRYETNPSSKIRNEMNNREKLIAKWTAKLEQAESEVKELEKRLE